MDPRRLAHLCDSRSGAAFGDPIGGVPVAVLAPEAVRPAHLRVGEWTSGDVRPGAVSPAGNVVALLPVEPADESVAGAVPAGRVRSRLRSPRRRPLALAAVLVGAAGVVLTTTALTGPASRATDGPQLGVAEELGLEKARVPAVTGAEVSDRLAALAAGRAEREDALGQAARAQADAEASAAAAARAAAANRAVLPVDGATLTSGFGYRWGVLHAGVDFAAPLGTPEHAAMDGVVVKAGPASGFGLAVYLQHANGDVTVYGHMEQILVTEGQVVKAGDTIALLGSNGQSTGPHLHFEVHLGGIAGEKVDPLPWLRDHGVVI